LENSSGLNGILTTLQGIANDISSKVNDKFVGQFSAVYGKDESKNEISKTQLHQVVESVLAKKMEEKKEDKISKVKGREAIIAYRQNGLSAEQAYQA